MTFDENISDAIWLDRLREAGRPITPGHIGPYELVSEVSRGGQGVVFRARQPGTHREVALKRLIGGTFATRAARARFEREIEVVCALSHANIVTVFGVETVDGQQVLAMEWIDGQPLDLWARGDHGAARPIGEILRVFLQVCEAVQYAHQRGVIHRDLKPSNVLVGGDATPHVIDFGLARAIDADDSAAVRLTLTAELLGTPAYASPEQVGLDGAGVDSRTDVYSLGAILYQLVCGRTPHDTARGLPALLESIRKDDPVPPSTLAPAIERDLDLITLKALAKDPSMRYQSVDALSADLRRYVSGEAVAAHPPSLAYQLRKLIRRHRMSFSFILIVFVLLAAFGATAAALALRLDRQRVAALEARANEADARAAAEEVSEFLRRMLAAARPQNAQGEEITVSQIVDQAVQQADASFQNRPAVEAAVRLTLGETLYGLGRHADAEKQLGQALTLLRQLYGEANGKTAWAVLHLAHARRAQGRLDEAMSLYDEALRIYRGLPTEKLRLASTLDSLASAYVQRSELATAERLLLEAQTLRTEHPDAGAKESVQDALQRSALQFRRGDFETAEAHLRGALELARSALGDRHELTVVALSNLAVALKQQGRAAEALPYSEECMATARLVFGADHSHTLQAAANRASLLQALKRYPEAESVYRELLDHFDEQGQLDHPTAIAAANNLGSLLLKLDRHGEAAALLRTTLDRARRVYGPRHPDTATPMGLLAAAVRGATPESDAAEARELLTEALAIFEATLPPDHPHIEKTRTQLVELTDQQTGRP